MEPTKRATHAEAAVMLREAREHLNKVGWTQRAYRTDAGKVCLLQALRDVDGTKHTKPVESEVYRILVKHINVKNSDDIPTWNDTTGRTWDDVLTILEACERMEQELAQ